MRYGAGNIDAADLVDAESGLTPAEVAKIQEANARQAIEEI